MKTVLFALILIAPTAFAVEPYVGIGVTNYGHSMSPKAPTLFLGVQQGKWHAEWRDMGRSAITDGYIRYRHIRGVLVSYGNGARFGVYAYKDGRQNIAPYLRFGHNLGLAYWHAVHDEDSSSHAWTLEYQHGF